ncbi:MAG: SPOR domain-containing protein, partial [Alphaproteobacteria bacterium]
PTTEPESATEPEPTAASGDATEPAPDSAAATLAARPHDLSGPGAPTAGDAAPGAHEPGDADPLQAMVAAGTAVVLPLDDAGKTAAAAAATAESATAESATAEAATTEAESPVSAAATESATTEAEVVNEPNDVANDVATAAETGAVAADEPELAVNLADVAAADPVLPASGVASGFRIWLASLHDEAAANQAWTLLSRRYGDVLGPLEPFIEPAASIDGGTLYRVQAGPFASALAAQEACATLGARSAYCVAIAP